MESLLPAPTRDSITKLVQHALADAKAELEVKVLAGQLQTKDEADRVVAALSELTSGGYTETHRATFSYSDGLRVHVTSPEQIL